MTLSVVILVVYLGLNSIHAEHDYFSSARFRPYCRFTSGFIIAINRDHSSDFAQPQLNVPSRVWSQSSYIHSQNANKFKRGSRNLLARPLETRCPVSALTLIRQDSTRNLVMYSFSIAFFLLCVRSHAQWSHRNCPSYRTGDAAASSRDWFVWFTFCHTRFVLKSWVLELEARNCYAIHRPRWADVILMDQVYWFDQFESGLSGGGWSWC